MRSSRVLVPTLAAALTLAWAAPAQAGSSSWQPLPRLGPERLVNTGAKHKQYFPAVAANRDGLTLVTWTDTRELTPHDHDHDHDHDDDGHVVIKGQLLDRYQRPIGNERTMARGHDANVSYPAVTALANGDFALAYVTTSPDAGSTMKVRTITPRGAMRWPVTANERTAPTEYSPSIAALRDGGFVAAWTGPGADDAKQWDPAARVFDATGKPRTGELRLGTTLAGRQSRPAVTTTGSGFVAAWGDGSASGEDTSGSAVRARAYRADGQPLGAERLVNDTTAGSQTRPSAATLTSGEVVIAWEDHGPEGDGDGVGVRARTFTPGLSHAGRERTLNTVTAKNQQKPSLAALPDGGYVAAWEDSSGTADPVWLGVRARRFHPAGTPAGTERLVNRSTGDNQQQPALAVSRNRLLVVWTDESHSAADKDETAVRAQALTYPTPPWRR